SNPDQYVAKISPQTATEIAISHLSTQASNLVKVDLDYENGVHTYSVEFIIGDQAVSVEIDPQTGQVLLVEQEPVGTLDVQDNETGDGETNDDTETNDGTSISDGDGETNDDLG
ncbi:MAG: PepSY domain-containing protein, partial [Nitrosarchaeum sp.]